MVVRLFIGGLPHDISADDIRCRFNPFGKVEAVDIVPPKGDRTAASGTQALSGATCRGFAYVELDPKDEISVHKCLSVYNHSKWRGNVLRVEMAKPSYLARLHVEWQAQAGLEKQRPQEPRQIPHPQSDLTTLLGLPQTAPTKAPLKIPQASSCSPPPPVSAASLAAATTAASAAAAKRAKAATRSSRSSDPVPPPTPADLTQPLCLQNPHNRHRPIEVDLAQPTKPPRRSFPTVPPLPLSRLEWQRDEDYGEQLLFDSDGDDDSDDVEGSRGGHLTDVPLNAGGVCSQPSKRRRIDGTELRNSTTHTETTLADAPSVLYYLNRIWAQPTGPYDPSTACVGVAGQLAVAQRQVGLQHGSGVTVPSARQSGFRQPDDDQLQEGQATDPPKELLRLQDEETQVAEAAVAVAASVAASKDGEKDTAPANARRLAQAPATVPKREVRGEMLSMFKVLKALDSENRKRSAEEAAGRLAAVRVAAARSGANGMAKGPRGTKQQQQKMALVKGKVNDNAAVGVAAVSAGDVGPQDDGGAATGGVVDFMDEEMDGVIIQQQQQQQQLLILDKFRDSDDEEEDDRAGGASGDSGQGGRGFVGRGKDVGGGPSGPSLLDAKPTRGSSSAGERDDKLATREKTARIFAVVPTSLPAVKSHADPFGRKQEKTAFLSHADGSLHAEVLPSQSHAATPARGPIVSNRALPGSRVGPAKRSHGMPVVSQEDDGTTGRGAGSPTGRKSVIDVPLVPLTGPKQRASSNPRVAGDDMLARFGNDSDGEEVFRDVDSDMDVGPRSRAPEPSGRGLPGSAAAVAASKRPSSANGSERFVSFLHDAEGEGNPVGVGGSREVKAGGFVADCTGVRHERAGSRETAGVRRRGGGRLSGGAPTLGAGVRGSEAAGASRHLDDIIGAAFTKAPAVLGSRAGPWSGPSLCTAAASVDTQLLVSKISPAERFAGGSHMSDMKKSQGATKKQASASAPPSLTRQPPGSGAPLLASSFVRSAGCSEEALRAAWMTSFGDLVEGARDNARSAQRAVQGRAGGRDGRLRKGAVGPRRR